MAALGHGLWWHYWRQPASVEADQVCLLLLCFTSYHDTRSGNPPLLLTIWSFRDPIFVLSIWWHLSHLLKLCFKCIWLMSSVIMSLCKHAATKFQSYAPNNNPGWSPSKQNRRCVMINMTSRDSAECSPLKLIRLDPLTGGGAGNGTRWNVQLLGTGPQLELQTKVHKITLAITEKALSRFLCESVSGGDLLRIFDILKHRCE